MEGVWGQKKRSVRRPREEEYNREGQWERQFSLRYEMWVPLESWASDLGYRLIAMRGQRRLYVKAHPGKLCKSYVDVRQSDRGVSLSAWAEPHFLLRLLYLLSLPSELNPEPGGLKGIRIRRGLCRDLNNLLVRLNQPIVFQSDRFHPADLDWSLYLLAGTVVASLAGFTLPLVAKMEVRAGLSNPLLEALGRQAGILAGVGAVLLAAQWFALKKLTRPLYRMLTAKGLGMAFLVLCILVFTRTGSEIGDTKFAYHCLRRFDAAECRLVLQRLAPAERERYRQRLHAIEKELSRL